MMIVSFFESTIFSPIQTRSPRWIGSARPGFPYRPSLRDGFGSARPGFPVPVSTMDFSGQMTFCRRKVRLRVICPAEGRFSGENRLPAQILPEPGFGGQIHANKEFVRQPRPLPYRHGLRNGLVRQGRVSRTERGRYP